MVRWLTMNSGKQYLSADPAKDLMGSLTDKAIVLGRKPSLKEADSDPSMFQINYYPEYFISFEHAAESAWDKAKQAISSGDKTLKLSLISYTVEQVQDSEIAIIEHSYPTLSDSSHLNTTKKGVTKMGKGYSERTAKRKLVNFYRRTGKVPSCSDAKAANDLPSYQTLLNLFGPHKNWEDIIMEEINPQPSSSANGSMSNYFETSNGQVTIDTDFDEENNTVKINLSIDVPGREKPIAICLTV